MNEETIEKITLIKASVIAFVIALVVYFVIILPAEFNRDPTGVGQWLGLTVLSKPVEKKPVLVQRSGDAKFQSDVVEVLVPAGKGVEYKFQLAKHENLTYEWITDGKPLYFDFHGEPEGDTIGYFESYTVATADEVKGSMTVPFAGTHGWYWENKSDSLIKLQLKTSGNYSVIGLK